ncbi:hypothetical protein I6A84_32300 [Frankia sp. CNm7]|uniref:Uncharacterized protein n=1 Tax=Frankia nepalensis TaxID=1836974 RepID=A0A937US47_9ACTN|nr:hypothetical protein [Frankia nepalensis]MBL7500274.1 hypothetical protein [Frankia nepalensis]MBL7511975.1 hypothetical protein [Frankia nepalensis]MBL7522644.1 hypothetical protein [Frankia nepalensis]MBL7631783.1 hypothetical protein [Frankia nepalensis]
MNQDDKILVGDNDRLIEPPDAYEKRVSVRWLDLAPAPAHKRHGADEWVFWARRTSTPLGMPATVGWPREEQGLTPGAFTDRGS